MAALTGKTRVRLGWRNKLILQVQRCKTIPIMNIYSDGTSGRTEEHRYSWSDATIEDLQAIEAISTPKPERPTGRDLKIVS